MDFIVSFLIYKNVSNIFPVCLFDKRDVENGRNKQVFLVKPCMEIIHI